MIEQNELERELTELREAESTLTAEYVDKDGKRLRRGFTTGSCAAAAAAAATQMILTGEVVPEVEILLPGDALYRAQIIDPEIIRGGDGPEPDLCFCSVRKDGGDDPDVTTGMLIRAEVTVTDKPGISIDGGRGVGRVTKPGLDQPVGAAAINSVPRQMITENVKRVIEEWEARSNRRVGAGRKSAPTGLHIVISAPGGEDIAEHTFNPRLGIVGGISILGTTGIVEPMSDQAVVETIRVQLNVLKAKGRKYVVMAPGNYGFAFLTGKYGVEEDEIVLISNFVADAVGQAAELGFEGILLAGHIGKLVKIAAGVRNTHSMYGDRRIETLWEIAREYCAEDKKYALLEEINDCVMTDAALEVLDKYGLKEQTAQEMSRRICANLKEWSGGKLAAETIVFSNKNSELVRSEGAKEMMGLILKKN